MLLQYQFEGDHHNIVVHWNDEKGSSVVFRSVVRQIAERHGLDTPIYLADAARLDTLVDKLYEEFYIFTNEYSGLPYNPRTRRSIITAFSNLSVGVEAFGEGIGSESKALLSSLFLEVVDKLQETVDVFLEDHTYQTKHRERRRHKEQLYETMDERFLSHEFEDVIVKMIDLMNCLTETQRRRLLQHLLMTRTMQEIADAENVTKAAVEFSIASALKRIRKYMDE